MYRNRLEAGKTLYEIIKERGLDKSLSFVFAVPRGGVEVAYPIAKGLKKPIIPILVHKVPSSINEEFAIGAISVAGEMLLNEYAQGEKREYIDKIKKEMLLKLSERQDFFGVKCNFEDVKGKEVLIVDDGIATGETIYLAVLSVKRYEPSRTVVAVPVSSLEGYERMSQLGEVICPIVDRYFYAVSEYYEEFGQLSDIEARRYIEESLKFGE